VESSTLSTASRGVRGASSITRGTSSGIGATAGKVAEVGLREEVELLSAENDALRLELDTTKQERDDYAATVDEFIKDHKRSSQKALTPEKRDRILNALGVGKQAPLYKRIKVVLDQFVNEV
jgi:hypothetical protein